MLFLRLVQLGLSVHWNLTGKEQLCLSLMGAGLASFSGPAIVAIFFASTGAKGVLIIFAALYFISIFLIGMLKPSKTG